VRNETTYHFGMPHREVKANERATAVAEDQGLAPAKPFGIVGLISHGHQCVRPTRATPISASVVADNAKGIGDLLGQAGKGSCITTRPRR
jgi:hypothetical protein